MNTAAFYKPAARWPVAFALGAALSIEIAAVALASLHRPEEIPTVLGVVTPQPIVAEFIASPPDLVTPENVPPPLPPLPDEPLEFISVEPPAVPHVPRQTSPVTPHHVAGSAAAPANFAATRARLTSAPPPAYPYEARRARATGSGTFLLRFDAAGEVVDVAVARSTGNAVLDQSSLNTFRRWRCQPGAYRAVLVPVTFTFAGAQL